jgi:hypothetical protein
MAERAVTYTSSMKPVKDKKFVCKRCKREYARPESGDPPIRCECGWWYENDHGTIKERYWQRIEPYREPPAKLFSDG